MADPNHSIFARIGILYILEIYQWVSPSIKDGYRKVKVDVLRFLDPIFRSVPRLGQFHFLYAHISTLLGEIPLFLLG